MGSSQSQYDINLRLQGQPGIYPVHWSMPNPVSHKDILKACENHNPMLASTSPTITITISYINGKIGLVNQNSGKIRRKDVNFIGIFY